MIINITNRTTGSDVQRKIAVAYPFLKIEFFRGSPEARPAKMRWYDHDRKLLEIAEKAEAGWIVIHPWHTTSDIKDAFEHRFGLHAQFFRRLDDDWIEITGTEIFTIEEQNQIGRSTVEKVHAPAWRERELLL